jgi:hypothetical protein
MRLMRNYFTNLEAPMPLSRKVWLLARNNFLRGYRIVTLQGSCCGHPGEPGC